MSEGPQYTDCVDKSSWVDIDPFSDVNGIGVANLVAGVAAIVAVIFGAGPWGFIAAFAAATEILRRVADWMLHAKLICLSNVKRRVFVNDPDTDRICVLGSVLDFERVGEGKSGPETIDNDFGVNLFLAPVSQAELMMPGNLDADGLAAKMAALKTRIEASAQGDLIQDPAAASSPLMRRDDGQPFGAMPAGFVGYQRLMMISSQPITPFPASIFMDPHVLAAYDKQYGALADAAYLDFQTEFAGTVSENGRVLTPQEKLTITLKAAADHLSEPRVAARFYELVDAKYHFKRVAVPVLHCEFEGARIRDVFNVLDFAHIECKKSGFWGFLCDVVNLVVSLFLGIPKLIAAAIAWALAEDGKLSNGYDGSGGELKLGDGIVVRGRWVYDSAHKGYNEIHAVRTLQKTCGPTLTDATFVDFHDRWCTELSKIPCDGKTHDELTTTQQTTRDAQASLENGWSLHPHIDGCVPAPPQPEPPPGPNLH
jgi:hypothetical protein